MDIYIDIETIPSQRADVKDMIAATAHPPRTITKPESLAKWYEEKLPDVLDEEWRKTALNGTFGELLCIGWAVDDDDPSCAIRTLDEPESTVLEMFFEQLGARMKSGQRRGVKPIPTWIGHYITGFDLRFIWQRAVICGIEPPFPIPYDAKPWNTDVYDTKTKWTGMGSSGGYGSLDKVCQALGYTGKGDMDGGKVWDAVLEDRYGEIGLYCMDDVEKTRRLHQRMTFKVTA